MVKAAVAGPTGGREKQRPGAGEEEGGRRNMGARGQTYFPSCGKNKNCFSVGTILIVGSRSYQVFWK